MGNPSAGVKIMKQEKKGIVTVIRVDPEEGLCPKFDQTSMALFPVARPGEMGVAVVDDCAEEHIM